MAEGDGLGTKVPGEYDFVIDDMVVPTILGGTGKICIDGKGMATGGHIPGKAPFYIQHWWTM